jgi:hypothetical protein
LELISIGIYPVNLSAFYCPLNKYRGKYFRMRWSIFLEEMVAKTSEGLVAKTPQGLTVIVSRARAGDVRARGEPGGAALAGPSRCP